MISDTSPRTIWGLLLNVGAEDLTGGRDRINPAGGAAVWAGFCASNGQVNRKPLNHQLTADLLTSSPPKLTSKAIALGGIIGWLCTGSGSIFLAGSEVFVVVQSGSGARVALGACETNRGEKLTPKTQQQRNKPGWGCCRYSLPSHLTRAYEAALETVWKSKCVS